MKKAGKVKRVILTHNPPKVVTTEYSADLVMSSGAEMALRLASNKARKLNLCILNQPVTDYTLREHNLK